jgi:hypothetical protein
MGRYKTMYLSGDLKTAVSPDQFTLICQPVMLRLYVNDELRQIPGYFSALTQKIIFELFSHAQDSMRTTYIAKNFFYDWDCDGETITCSLVRLNESNVSLGSFSPSDRTDGEVNITKKGRFRRLEISGDFTHATNFIRIYGLELSMRSAPHHKDR